MVSANAVNGVKAGLGSSYLAQVVAGYAAELRDEAGAAAAATGAGTGVASRYLFNPSLDYKAFMVPGLIAMLLVLVGGVSARPQHRGREGTGDNRTNQRHAGGAV